MRRNIQRSLKRTVNTRSSRFFAFEIGRDNSRQKKDVFFTLDLKTEKVAWLASCVCARNKLNRNFSLLDLELTLS